MRDDRSLQIRLTEALTAAIKTGLDDKSTKEQLMQSLHDVTATTVTDYVNDEVGQKVILIRGFSPSMRGSANFIGNIDEGLASTVSKLAPIYKDIEEIAENLNQPRIMMTLKKIDIYTRTAVSAIMKATGEFMSSLVDAITINAKKEFEELEQSGNGMLKKGGFLETFFGEMAVAEMQSKTLDKAPVEKFNQALDILIGPIEEEAAKLVSAAKKEIEALDAVERQQQR